MRSWLSYAAAGMLLTLLAAVIAGWVSGPAGRSGVWFAAGLAYVMQLVAFGVLRAARDAPQLFMGAWAGGILLRFGAVGAVAFWLRRDPVLPLAATLVSLVVFVVLLLLLEPVFLRGGGDRAAVREARGRVNEGAN